MYLHDYPSSSEATLKDRGKWIETKHNMTLCISYGVRSLDNLQVIEHHPEDSLVSARSAYRPDMLHNISSNISFDRKLVMVCQTQLMKFSTLDCEIRLNYICIHDWYASCFFIDLNHPHSDGLVQDCSTASALAMEILQSCTKPSI